MNRMHHLFLKYPNIILILLIVLVYLFFMNEMMMRTTGDEKTYVAQALEMERDGSWFVQTWADENDYYKGPLHFIALRVGFILFGHESMFATLYMNFFGLIIATLLLHRMFKTHLNDASWALFYAGSFATSLSLYAHMFASQMEAELVIVYAITLYLLWKLDDKESLPTYLLLWSIIGIAGWLKSPAHSVFLALSVLLYWILSSQWRERLRRRIVWWTLLWGIGVGIAGYLPILIADSDTFISNYIIKESFDKGANGVGWTTAFFPLFTYFLAPWMFAFIFSLTLAVRSSVEPSLRLDTKETQLMKLSIAIIIPTLLFFTLHPYRGDIYALPAVSASLLIAILYWRAHHARFSKVFMWLVRLSALVLSTIPLSIIILEIHFYPLPHWWSNSLLWVAIFGGVGTLMFSFYESKKLKERGPALLIITFVPLYWMLGITLHTFGKAEMYDIETYIAKKELSEPIGYYNLHRNVWNEYGYLNFWIQHRIVGIHTKEALILWLNEGKSLIIPGERHYKECQKLIQTEFDFKDFEIHTWRRWLTHGKTPSGESKFIHFWKTKKISEIQQDFFIIQKNNYL